jgi:calcineurin-like phosphoesterase family protein
VLDRNLNAKHTHKYETGLVAKQAVHYLLGDICLHREKELHRHRARVLADRCLVVCGNQDAAESRYV